jgi:hypothetical protein
MSILVEIAEKADVSVEGVVRVLTREPVSDAVKERVLAVLDELTPEQTRAVQRFALAALHDVLLRPGDAVDLAAAPVSEEGQPALPAAPRGSDAAFVQLGSVLGELAEAVRDLRRETDAERRERVDDLAVLIDLITTGWQGLDARLGRIEKQVSRLEAGRREPIVIAPTRVVPPAVEQPPPAVEQPPPAIEPKAPGGRGKLPIVATLSLLGAAIATLAVLQLASGGPDVSRLVSSRESSTTATGEASATTSPGTSTRAGTRPAATTPRPPAQSPSTPATTSDVRGTSSGATAPSKPPAATTRPATTAASASGFQPTRSWAWAPVKNAAYYDVVFTRSGKVFYAGKPTEPRLTLPRSLVFQPGAYRWVVRPGFGDRAAKNLGPPVVDSPFTVA